MPEFGLFKYFSEFCHEEVDRGRAEVYVFVEYFFKAWCCICETDGWDWQCYFSFHQRQLIRKTFYANQTKRCFHLLSSKFSIPTKNTLERSTAFLKKHFSTHGEVKLHSDLSDELAVIHIQELCGEVRLSGSLCLFFFGFPCWHLHPFSQCFIYETILNKTIFVQYKMVALTFAGQKNGKTVYFDVLIPKVHFMKLFSCSFYNSWHNLKSVGQIPVEESGDASASLSDEHYTAERG